jgi:hypothetical protein
MIRAASRETACPDSVGGPHCPGLPGAVPPRNANFPPAARVGDNGCEAV